MTIGWPLKHNRIRRGLASNTFGMVRRKADGSKRPHQGWDFEASVGTPCFAIADGRVALTYTSTDYGEVLVLEFTFEGRELFAAYAHLSAIEVRFGDRVTKGQRVALTGDSGNAKGMSGPDEHLHFEIRTVARPGVGLAGRVSPLEIFRHVPLDKAVEA